MKNRFGPRVVAVGLLLGAAACAAAPPAPSTDEPRSARPLPSQAARVEATATPRASAAPSLGTLDLDVGAVDEAWTEPLLEFASDGESVIFSSGVSDGQDGAFAPDLWRYTPGADAPELLWRNERRDRSLVRIAGDRDTWAFVEMPLDNTRAWDLWLLTDPGGDAVHLDTHPGDEDVPSIVPSFVVHEGQVAWTAFDQGASGPVSQLLYATAPDWEPIVVEERPAREAELWFPTLRGSLLAYSEAVYSEDRLTDERFVFLVDLTDLAAPPRRLDASGRATMPLLVDDGVVWKEADRGFSMFNWGRLYLYDLPSGEVAPLSMHPQEYVNYPSAGYRFVAAWGADAFTFTIHDLDVGMSRWVARYDDGPSAGTPRPSVPRAHVAGDLLVWLYSTVDDSAVRGRSELRYAFLPGAGTDRDR